MVNYFNYIALFTGQKLRASDKVLLDRSFVSSFFFVGNISARIFFVTSSISWQVSF